MAVQMIDSLGFRRRFSLLGIMAIAALFHSMRAFAAVHVTPGADLHKIYRNYTRAQWRYNTVGRQGALKLFARRFKDGFRGRTPYWDIPKDTPGLEILGHLEGSPLEGPEGTVRISCHFKDSAKLAALLKRFKEPTGYLESLAQNSSRTLTHLPKTGEPFSLKYSSAEKWLHPDKDRRFDRKELGENLAYANLHANDPTVYAESAAVLLKLSDNLELGILSRQLPAADSVIPFEKGDSLVSLAVLLSPDFHKTKKGSALFSPFGGFRGWAEAELLPALARTLVTSVFVYGDHFELHSQNIDIHFAEGGKIRTPLIKDLMDNGEDPVLQLALNGDTPRPSELRNFSGEFLTEASRGGETVTEWWREYFGQVIRDLTLAVGNTDRDFSPNNVLRAEFQRSFKDLLKEKKIGIGSLKKSRDFQNVFANPAPAGSIPLDFISSARELVVKASLAKHFKSDPAQKAKLLRAVQAIKRDVSEAAYRSKEEFKRLLMETQIEPASFYGAFGEQTLALKSSAPIKNPLDYLETIESILNLMGSEKPKWKRHEISPLPKAVRERALELLAEIKKVDPALPALALGNFISGFQSFHFLEAWKIRLKEESPSIKVGTYFGRPAIIEEGPSGEVVDHMILLDEAHR